jgi:hypothetical protein
MKILYKIIVTFIILLLCVYIFYLKVQIHTLSKNTIPVDTIESYFYNTLGSFNNEIEFPKNDLFQNNQLIIRNSNDLAQFYGMCTTLFSIGDSNIFELINKVGDYYYFMRNLSYKVQNNQQLTAAEKEKYQQIYNNMHLLKSKISVQGRNEGTFNHLGKLYSNLKNEWVIVKFN